ncbi:hypothetical protein F5Y12DRAFT_257087 [Xylaria sp. FL1777]|nr:hypothetical protein F5Y12DRAFT_257087 [Xylaria sp. FL1777]
MDNMGRCHFDLPHSAFCLGHQKVNSPGSPILLLFHFRIAANHSEPDPRSIDQMMKEIPRTLDTRYSRQANLSKSDRLHSEGILGNEPNSYRHHRHRSHAYKPRTCYACRSRLLHMRIIKAGRSLRARSYLFRSAQMAAGLSPGSGPPLCRKIEENPLAACAAHPRSTSPDLSSSQLQHHRRRHLIRLEPFLDVRVLCSILGNTPGTPGPCSLNGLPRLISPQFYAA